MICLSSGVVHTHDVLQVPARRNGGSWREGIDRRRIRQIVFEHLCSSFKSCRKCGTCNAFRRDYNLTGWKCDKCRVNLLVLVKSNTEATAALLKYVLRRRIDGKRQFERIKKQSVSRQYQLRERLRWPNLYDKRATPVGVGLLKRRASGGGTVEPEKEIAGPAAKKAVGEDAAV